jgi:hypothetical protein
VIEPTGQRQVETDIAHSEDGLFRPTPVDLDGVEMPSHGEFFFAARLKKAPKSGFRFTIRFSFVKPLVSRIPRSFRGCES